MNIKDDFKIAIRMMRVPSNTMEQLRSKTLLDALEFLLIVGAVTALLTPLQIYLGYEDVNGLHAGGQAESLARDLSILLKLGLEWRPVLIEALYMIILAFSTLLFHGIFKSIGGKGSIEDTFKMIAYGDAPGLLFGWVPYFATISAVWSAVIQLSIGPIVLHRISWAKASIVFSVFIGLGIVDIALS